METQEVYAHELKVGNVVGLNLDGSDVKVTKVDIDDFFSRDVRVQLDNGQSFISDRTTPILIKKVKTQARYYFRSHDSTVGDLVDKGSSLWENASVIVDENNVVHKAEFDKK